MASDWPASGERLKELGGSLEIESNFDGALPKATIPISLHHDSEPDAEDGLLPSGDESSALPAD